MLTAARVLPFMDYGLTSKGVAFESHDAASVDAAVVVARFAHTYDVPHALKRVQAHLTTFMSARFKNKDCVGLTNWASEKNVLAWAVMAEIMTCISSAATASGPW